MLEKGQEKAVKMVTGLKAVSYEDRCAELGLETLQVRKERLDMALVHKYIGKENQTLFRMMSENSGARTQESGRCKKHCIKICQDRHKEGILRYQSSRDLE